jgi:hypothetical protein
MIKIEEYPSLMNAFGGCMIKDLEYVLILHSYPKGTKIIPHIHEKADEFVIASKGHFIIYSEEITSEFQLDGTTTISIYYPTGREHGLTVLGDKLDYFVLRTS